MQFGLRNVNPHVYWACAGPSADLHGHLRSVCYCSGQNTGNVACPHSSLRSSQSHDHSDIIPEDVEKLALGMHHVLRPVNLARIGAVLQHRCAHSHRR